MIDAKLFRHSCKFMEIYRMAGFPNVSLSKAMAILRVSKNPLPVQYKLIITEFVPLNYQTKNLKENLS